MLFLSVIECEMTRTKIEELYFKYSKDLLKYAKSMLKDHYEAEDVVHNVFIKSAEYIDENTDVNDVKIKGLLFLMTKNSVINIVNKRNKNEHIPVENVAYQLEDEKVLTPELNILRLDAQEEMAIKLAQIKPEYANIICLKYFHEMSNNEIADVMSISDSNVRVKLHRAKNALLKIIGGGKNE